MLDKYFNVCYWFYNFFLLDTYICSNSIMAILRDIQFFQNLLTRERSNDAFSSTSEVI